jgi:hypothetical protein
LSPPQEGSGEIREGIMGDDSLFFFFFFFFFSVSSSSLSFFLFSFFSSFFFPTAHLQGFERKGLGGGFKKKKKKPLKIRQNQTIAK